MVDTGFEDRRGAYNRPAHCRRQWLGQLEKHALSSLANGPGSGFSNAAQRQGKTVAIASSGSEFDAKADEFHLL